MPNDGVAVAERRSREMLIIQRQVLLRVYHGDQVEHQACINYGGGWPPTVYFTHNGIPYEYAPPTIRDAYRLASSLVRSSHRDICKRRWCWPWGLKGPEVWHLSEHVNVWRDQ